MDGTLYIVLIVIAIILFWLFIPRFLIKRAISQVIKTFQYHNALNAKDARTIDELGLTPPTFSQRMFRTRDYKPQALDLLMRGEIVLTTEDGRLYLSQEKLDAAGFLRR